MNRIRRSPLIKRLRRHAGFGVLFPSSDGEAFAGIRAQTKPHSDNVPVVQARLLKPGEGLAEGYLDISHTVSRIPEAGKTSRPDESHLGFSGPAEVPSTPTPAGVPEDAAAHQEIRDGESDPGGFTDSEWRRLSTIMRRHEIGSQDAGSDHKQFDQTEAQTAEPRSLQTAPLVSGPVSPDQEQISPQEIQPFSSQAEVDETVIHSPSTPLQPDDPQESAEQQIRRSGRELQHADPNAVQREYSSDAAGEMLDLPPFLEQREYESTNAAAATTGADQIPVEIDHLRQPEADHNALTPAEDKRAEAFESEPSGISEDLLANEKLADVERPVQSQPVEEPAGEVPRVSGHSLEEVWPVQFSRTQSQDIARPVSSEGESSFVDDEAEGAIRRVIDDIPSGEKSGSAIEWVPPRRARPKVPPNSVQRVQGEARRTPESQGPDAQPTLTASPDVESMTNVEPTEPGRAEPWLVPTEIGTLPADLWKLIGEQPPSQEKAPGQVSGPTGTLTREQKTQPAQPFSHVQPKEASEGSKPQIQVGRPTLGAIERVSTPTASEAEDEPDLAENDPQAEGDTLDTDEIARQVYTRLRSRLAIEWERLRQRF